MITIFTVIGVFCLTCILTFEMWSLSDPSKKLKAYEDACFFRRPYSPNNTRDSKLNNLLARAIKYIWFLAPLLLINQVSNNYDVAVFLLWIIVWLPLLIIITSIYGEYCSITEKYIALRRSTDPIMKRSLELRLQMEKQTALPATIEETRSTIDKIKSQRKKLIEEDLDFEKAENADKNISILYEHLGDLKSQSLHTV
jgi:hypothetical protein